MCRCGVAWKVSGGDDSAHLSQGGALMRDMGRYEEGRWKVGKCRRSQYAHTRWRPGPGLMYVTDAAEWSVALATLELLDVLS